jgi:hypothetical protein
MRARSSRQSTGFSSTEVFVAVAVFGLALSGLGTSIVSQLRMMHAIERRVYVLAPMGSTIEVVGYDLASNDFTYSQSTSTEATDILGPTNTWAMRLGVSVLVGKDGRSSALPATVAPAFTLLLDGPLDAYQPSNNVSVPSAIQDDGTTMTAVVQAEAIRS